MCLGRLLNIIGLAISMLGTLLMLFGGFDAFVKIRPVGPAWRPNVSQACLGDEHGGYIQAGTKGLFIKAGKAHIEFTGPDVDKHRLAYRWGLVALCVGFFLQLTALLLDP